MGDQKLPPMRSILILLHSSAQPGNKRNLVSHIFEILMIQEVQNDSEKAFSRYFQGETHVLLSYRIKNSDI